MAEAHSWGRPADRQRRLHMRGACEVGHGDVRTPIEPHRSRSQDGSRPVHVRVQCGRGGMLCSQYVCCAVEDFKKRIAMYEKDYEPLGEVSRGLGPFQFVPFALL